MKLGRSIIVMSLMCGTILAHAQFASASPSEPRQTPAVSDERTLQELLTAHRPNLEFRPGDIIAVSVYGLAAFSGSERIEQDGSVRFPFVGRIQVAGLTVSGLENTVSKELIAAGIVRDPQVVVSVVTQPWNVVTVSGDVQKAGMFPAGGNLTLIDYLSEAGGLQDNLAGTNTGVNSPASPVVTLIRPTLSNPITVQIGPDPTRSPFARIPLFGGDEVRVGKVGIVYAVGAFKSQGAFPLKNTGPTTVLQLVALAGGIGYEGDLKDAQVIRTDGAARYMLGVNVKKILQGKMRDVALQSGDIVVVPTNEMKAAIKGGGAGAIVTLGAAALYTHP